MKRENANLRYTMLIFSVAFLLCLVGMAEQKAPASTDEDFVTEKRSDGTTVKYKKKSTYDFEGASIDGLYNKPSGSYISNIKDVKGKSIFRIRENFDAEVGDSARLLK